MVEHVIVMYAGQIVEQGTVDEVLIEPRAPYTMGLLESIPTVDEARRPAVRDQGHGAVALQPAARAAGSSRAARTTGSSAARSRPSSTRPGVRARLARCLMHTPEGEGHWADAQAKHRAALNVTPSEG